MIGAQVRADEQMAELLSKELGMERQVIENRFINEIEKRGSNLKKGELNREEERAERSWCVRVQEKCFAEKIRFLKKGSSVPKSSRINQLSPYVETCIICLKGKTDNCTELSFQTKRLIILDNKHGFTKLLVQFYHSENNHIGVQQTLNEIRQKF
ncbi:hypothetical protein JTB14_036172 [Gonioctena quinquepunctata]|nr:hypothetical protein JTB14_036172 [Gonioctena quinquepunctata]